MAEVENSDSVAAAVAEEAAAVMEEETEEKGQEAVDADAAMDDTEAEPVKTEEGAQQVQVTEEDVNNNDNSNNDDNTDPPTVDDAAVDNAAVDNAAVDNAAVKPAVEVPTKVEEPMAEEELPSQPVPAQEESAPAQPDVAMEDVVKTEESTEQPQSQSQPQPPKEEAEVQASAQETPSKDVTDEKPESPAGDDDSRPAIWEPNEPDVLSGRGASVNAHAGNKKFRALCFARKPEFDVGNHAAKRRIATEIVAQTYNGGEARFLKKKDEKGPWYEMTKEQAILKACQVMRDYKRPDRLAIREMMAQNGQARKRSRQTESTPMLDVPVPTGPLEPIIENPFGVHDHDILCGRGAYVNGHVGNGRLRTLAQERKAAFDAGNYTEKRTLAGEIVQIIKSLDPPGRFLKRTSAAKVEKSEEDSWGVAPKTNEGEWEELSHEKAIHKACQVMRDIDRPDRKDREERRAQKKQKLLEGKGIKLPGVPASVVSPAKTVEEETSKTSVTGDVSNETDVVPVDKAEATASEKTAVEEAVAATEEALDKAMHAEANKTQEEIKQATETSSIEV